MSLIDSDVDIYARWAQLHGGVDPRSSRWVFGWVRLAHLCARPFVRMGMSPNAISLLGVAMIATSIPAAAAGGWWPLLAAVIIVVSAVLDGVDGAVAIQTDADTRWGKVVDPLADRCADLILIAVVVIVGAPAWLGATMAVATLLLESTRATAQASGMTGPGVITLWERPSRVIVAVFAVILAPAASALRGAEVGIVPDAVTGAGVATLCAASGAVVACVGLVQLLIAIRRQLQVVAS